jgi:hypothetical protein
MTLCLHRLCRATLAVTPYLLLQPDFVIFMLAWLLRVHRASL